jgi:beta-N-acetylhexosaminidase
MAAGKQKFSFGDAARTVWPAAEVVRVGESDELPAAAARPVVVVRDALVHPWQQAVAERLLASHPDAVVVETGFPGWRPAGAAGFVATHGGGRASLEAAVAVLAGR